MQILGISTNYPFSQKAFADSLQLPFPLLSDFPKFEVTRRYGGLNPARENLIARRAFFLIDRQGIVRGKWIPPPEDLFPSEPILKALRGLQLQ